MKEILSNQHKDNLFPKEENFLSWNEVLDRFKKTFGNDVYESWIKNIYLKNEFNHYVILSAPTRFVRDWIVSRYADKILDIIKGFKKSIQRIEFLIEEGDEKNIKTDFSNKRQITSIENSLLNYNRFNTNNRFDNFVVGESNELAYTAARKICVQSAHYNPLFIYGGVGMGKTHLLTAIASLLNNSGANAIYVTAEEFTNEYINSIRLAKTDHFRNKYRFIDALLIDDIQFLAGKEQTQEGFFHTFNSLITAGKQIVISSDRPAKEINPLHDRLVSRMLGGLIVDIQQPDLETKVAILKSKSESLNTNISGEILLYFAEQITSNIRALEGCINKIKAYSQLTNFSPDMSLAKSIVSEISPGLKNFVATKTSIIESVCSHFGLSSQMVLGNSRNSKCVMARQVYMYILREDLNLSLAEISESTGKRHSSIIYSCNQIINNLQSNSSLLDDVTSIRSNIKRKLSN